MAELDIIIPVYNEGKNIASVLAALDKQVKTKYRILICYDMDEDNTLPVIKDYSRDPLKFIFLKNPGRGPHSAVRAGLKASTAKAVLVYMADDNYNVALIDKMVDLLNIGYDVVAASRFIDGGSMQNCSSLIKSLITRLGAITLHSFAGSPVHDGTNAFRLFSRRLLNNVELESKVGFTFSIELLAKAYRLGFNITEIPAMWLERKDKASRFKVFRWLPHYLPWLLHIFLTTWFKKKS